MIHGRVSDQLAEWFAAGVEAHKGGDEVAYEVFPAPNPNGGFSMQFVVIIPSAVLGQQLAVGWLADSPLALTEESVGDLCKYLLEQGREQRSKILAETDPGTGALGQLPEGLLMP